MVDFVAIMPGTPKAKVKSRIILTPEHAKRFQSALADNIRRYEESHGEIDSKDPPPIPLNFGPTGEAEIIPPMKFGDYLFNLNKGFKLFQLRLVAYIANLV